MWLYTVARFIFSVCLNIGFRFKVKGAQNIPASGGFILAGNHVSYLDPIVLGVACPRKLNFMARHDLFGNPFFSGLLAQVGAFPVKRDSADTSAIKEAIRRLKSGAALVIFPEGSRSPDGSLSQPQAGIGLLAARLDVPIIPAYIKGTEKAWPRNAKFIRPSRISVKFGHQIILERRMPYQQIAQKIMEGIKQLSCPIVD